MVLTKNTKKIASKPITKFTKQAKEEGKITIFTDSENYKRDFVCVSDICEIHEKMFDVKEKGVYNIGTGTAISFKEVADLIAQKHNAEIKYISCPTNLKITSKNLLALILNV